MKLREGGGPASVKRSGGRRAEGGVHGLSRSRGGVSREAGRVPSLGGKSEAVWKDDSLRVRTSPKPWAQEMGQRPPLQSR